MIKKLNNKSGEVFLGVVAGLLLATIGHIQYVKGEWGPNGKQAVKNCIGTHVNGNCHNAELSEVEKDNFGIIDFE